MRSTGFIRHGVGRHLRHVSILVILTLIAGFFQVAPAQAAPGGHRYNPVDSEKSVEGRAVKTKPRKRDASVTRPAPDAKISWPAPGSVEVDVPAAPTKTVNGEKVPPVPAKRAGHMPIWVTPTQSRPTERQQPAKIESAGKVKIRILDRKQTQRADVEGLLFTVGRTDVSPTVDQAALRQGRLGVRVDYSGFGQAFGGSYGSRLRLVQLPACAITTPDAPQCQKAVPLDSANNTESRTLTANVNALPQPAEKSPSSVNGSAQAQPTVLAAVAGEASDKGDYKATSLQPSAAWKISPQSGEFNWSYEMRTPPVPGGLEPTLSLGYSSSSIDGRTSNGNSQPSWVGDGFELWPGYIERRYKSCRDDGAPKDEHGRYPGDQCWGYDNATLMLNGRGGELIPVGDGVWRMKNDDGTRVEQLKSAETDNGDNDGEHWKVTTPEGTQYYFGLNKLSGWTTGKPQTNSTWTTPVFGDDENEFCHKASGFADSWCQQGWRWNLDYAVDVHGNAISYYYTKETNHYGRNLKEADETPYTRAGYIDHIEYGLRSDNLFPAKAPARVDFEVSERCIRENASECDPGGIKDHPDYWWDVPWDLNCAADTECKEGQGALGPTFWSRKRLTKVSTSVINAEGTGYRPVDSWQLKHAWGMADIDRQLLLESILHTGEVTQGETKPIVMPPVSFVYKQLQNRVDELGDDLGPYVKNRLTTVYNETGGLLDVNYSAEDCTTNSLPTAQDNRRRCFPTYWDNGTNGDKPALDWFHKYVVTQTAQTDLTGKSADMVTDYDYSIGQPAWHFDDDDGLTPERYKTWSQWHGFSKVRVTARNPGGTASQVDRWYMQGMHGDRAGESGGTKTVTVADGEGGTYEDHESAQGFEVRTVNYTAPGGAVASKTVQSPWHKQTASRTRPWGTVTANLTGFKTVRTLTALDGGTWRETKATNNRFDDLTGQPVEVETLGDTRPEITNDDRCTTTTLLHNTTAGILGAPAQVQTVAAKCGTSVDYTKQLVSDARTYFDKGSFKQPPTRGDVTQVDKVAASGTTTSTVKYVPATKTTYDAYGRPTAQTQVDNTAAEPVEATTTTVYTDTHGLATKSSVTSPPAKRGDTTTTLTTHTEYEAAWGLPAKETDAGGKNTVTSYDPLGRVSKIWGPNRNTSQSPDREYDYTVNLNEIVAVLTKTLNNSSEHDSSYELFDGWLRPRQTQEPGPDGGRLISDTFYNPLGKVDRRYEAYYADNAPGKGLFGVDEVGQVETQTVYDYDGLGRTTAEKLLVGNSDTQERWRTRYSYGGDYVTVTPPQGGTPTTTVTDALGRTVELRQQRAAGPGAFAVTTYTYDDPGRLTQIKAHGGHTWTYGHDIRGRKVTSDDPDKGVTRYTYDDLDQLALTENAKGDKVAVVYDDLGRKTEQRAGSATGTKLAEWTYDTVRKGLPATSTRYDGDATYTSKINFYDNLNRPTSTTIKLSGLSAAESPLAPANGYTFTNAYNLDGTLKFNGFPAAGGLGGETFTHTYNNLGWLTKATGSMATGMLLGSDYTKTGKLIGQQLGTSATGNKTSLTYTYEAGTQRLRTTTAVHDGQPGVDRNATYTYQDAGNLAQITDVSRDGTDNQCFQYDDLQRLTDAWTPETPTGTDPACAATPQAATLGGPAPYRTAYTYDETGNRKGETQYGSGDQILSTRSYSYANGEGVDPKYRGHQLASVTQTGQGSHTETYGYDPTGNTTTRGTSTGVQQLTWGIDGELTKVTDPKGDTGYAYTADGDRLIRRDPAGTTLYLPGMEVRLDKGSTTPKPPGTTAPETRHWRCAPPQASRSWPPTPKAPRNSPSTPPTAAPAGAATPPSAPCGPRRTPGRTATNAALSAASTTPASVSPTWVPASPERSSSRWQTCPGRCRTASWPSAPRCPARAGWEAEPPAEQPTTIKRKPNRKPTST